MQNVQPRWTKNDMARVVVQALKNMDKPAAADHPEVLKMARNHKAARLTEMRDHAIEIINRNRMAAQ